MQNPQSSSVQLEVQPGNLSVLPGTPRAQSLSVRGDLTLGQWPQSPPFFPWQELHRTCRAMQQRVLELIPRIANEQLTEELLIVNDNLNNVFLRHER